VCLYLVVGPHWVPIACSTGEHVETVVADVLVDGSLAVVVSVVHWTVDKFEFGFRADGKHKGRVRKVLIVDDGTAVGELHATEAVRQLGDVCRPDFIHREGGGYKTCVVRIHGVNCLGLETV